VARTALRTKLQESMADQLTDIVVDAVLTIQKPDQPLDLFMVCAVGCCFYTCTVLFSGGGGNHTGVNIRESGQPSDLFMVRECQLCISPRSRNDGAVPTIQKPDQPLNLFMVRPWLLYFQACTVLFSSVGGDHTG
jgi:hypothetical protein